MIHKDLRLVPRSASMSRETSKNTKNGRETMIRKAYWGALAAPVLLALAFSMGCSSNPQSPILSPVTTVSSTAPFAQTQLLTTAYAAPFQAAVATDGNPSGGVIVTFTVTPSVSGAGGTFANGSSSTTATTATATTDDTTIGVAQSPAFTSNTVPGTFLVTASAEGTQSTAIFTVTNTLTPVTFTTTGGDNQSATVSTAFGTALSVTVMDGSVPPKPVVGIVVTFTAPATGASGTFADSSAATTTAMTNSSGVATAAAFTANANLGSYTVTAKVPVVQSATSANDTWLSTSFNLTNTPPPPSN